MPARSHATFTRPAAPITATVYPQPQNHPTSPITLAVHRTAPPTQSPARFAYNPQTPNGVMIRTPPQSNLQCVVNQERNDNSAEQPLGVRQKSPNIPGQPPPRYSVANARPQQQVRFRRIVSKNYIYLLMFCRIIKHLLLQNSFSEKNILMHVKNYLFRLLHV